MFISTLTPARVRRQLYAYFSDLDSSDDHDTDNIVWVLKRVVGPLFLLLTLTWEYQAVDRSRPRRSTARPSWTATSRRARGS